MERGFDCGTKGRLAVDPKESRLSQYCVKDPKRTRAKGDRVHTNKNKAAKCGNCGLVIVNNTLDYTFAVTENHKMDYHCICCTFINFIGMITGCAMATTKGHVLVTCLVMMHVVFLEAKQFIIATQDQGLWVTQDSSSVHPHLVIFKEFSIHS